MGWHGKLRRMSSAGRAEFVGREREFAVLDSALAAAKAGRGMLVGITGEPGIGKTRLAEEVAIRAADHGFAVAWGAGWPEGGAPPYWPWQDLLGQLGGEGGDDILPAGPAGDAPTERFVRFRAVAARLNRLAAEQPALLVLDDAHAVDTAAALLTRFVARSLRAARVLVLVTARDEVPDEVDALLGEGIRLFLTGLANCDVAALLRAQDGSADPERTAELVELTGGNPLYLREALSADRSGAIGSVPGVVRPLLLRRLAVFPLARRDVLAAAAVLGPAVDDATDAAAAGVDAGTVRTVRDVGRAVGLLRTGAGTEFRFTHGLLREALLDELGPDAVAQLHVRAAAALAASSTGSAQRRLVARAQHLLFAAAHGVTPVDVAVDTARAAAAAERDRGGHEPAGELLRAAIDLLAGTTGAPPALWLELAQAELAGGRLRASRASFRAALDGPDADPVTVAEAAIGLGGIWVFEHRTLEDIERYHGTLERAIDGLGTERPDLLARLRARLAAERVYLGTGDVEDVRAEVARLRAAGDQRGLAETLSLLHHVLLGPQYQDEREQIAAELADAAAATGDTVLAVMAELWRTINLFLAGDPDAERALAGLRQRADALRVDAVLYIVELIDVMLMTRAGRLAEAETLAQNCFARGGEVGDADAIGYLGAQVLGIRWLQGRAAETLPLAREIAASPTLVPIHRIYPAAVAALAALTGNAATEEAWRNLDALSTAGLDTIPPSSNWLLTLHCVIEAAEALGDRTTSAAAYDVLLPFAELPVLASLAVMCFGSSRRPLGLAARACGRTDDAVAHLEAAVEANRRLGNRPLLALARADLGVTLLRRGRGNDPERGAALLSVGVRALETMGLAERAAGYQPPVAGAEESAALRFEAGKWELRCGADRLVLADGVGLRYLARLLAAPGRDIGADELAGGAADGHRQEILDDTARRQYKRRVEELGLELDAADAAGDADRAEQAQAELDRLLAELSAATGLAGRTRTFADDRERARTAVQKAIRRAIARIGEQAPTLADQLTASVQTGLVCRFDPARDIPKHWTVELERNH